MAEDSSSGGEALGPAALDTVSRAAPRLATSPPLPQERPVRTNVSSPAARPATASEGMTKEEKRLIEKIEKFKVKCIRLVRRLDLPPEDNNVSRLLYRIGLAGGIRNGRHLPQAFDIRDAELKASQLDAANQDLDFSCRILLLGKAGVGKSATLNSIFGKEKSAVNAFKCTSSSVKEIVSEVDGVKLHVIDTPGLKTSPMEQAYNRRILSAAKKNRCSPDVVLYIDRLDAHGEDSNDLPLLKTITETLGHSIWSKTLIAFTHAASDPPEDATGASMNYEMYCARRSHGVQLSIRRVTMGIVRMNQVTLVENHPSCRRNREGHSVLPNGLCWRSHMLFLCYSAKLFSEMDSIIKAPDSAHLLRLFENPVRLPGIPYLLSTSLDSKARPTQSYIDSAIALADMPNEEDSEYDGDDEEYDMLPSFRSLKKAQLAKLTKEQKKAYHEEYDYRVKLLEKKVMKEARQRLKEMKKLGINMQEDYANEDDVPEIVSVPSQDNADKYYGDRTVMQKNIHIAGRFPAGVKADITKDKRLFSMKLNSSVMAEKGDSCILVADFDIETLRQEKLAYTLRTEAGFKSLKKHRTNAELSMAYIGDHVETGLKISDRFPAGEGRSLSATMAAVRSQGQGAFGLNLLGSFEESKHWLSQLVPCIGLSLVSWHGDWNYGLSLPFQFVVGRKTKVIVQSELNKEMRGLLAVKAVSSEHLSIAATVVFSFVIFISRKFVSSFPFTTLPCLKC